MAVTGGTISVGTGDGVSSVTFNHTVVAGDNLIVVYVAHQRTANLDAVSTVKWKPGDGDEQSFTKKGSVTNAAAGVRIDLWYLHAPVQASDQITVTLTGGVTPSVRVIAAAKNFAGTVNSGDPFRSINSGTGSSSSVSLSVSSDVADLVIDLLGLANASGTISPDSGQTSEFGARVGTAPPFGSGATDGRGSSEPGAASVTMGWSWTGTFGYAYGVGSLQAAASQTLSPTGIASAEAFGTPKLVIVIFPSGIPSAEAFGTATLAASIAVDPTGIPSAEAFGTALLEQEAGTLILVGGIPSEEVFGIAFLRGGFIAVSLKKRIRDKLIETAQLGTFIEVDYDDAGVIQQGLQVQPASITANEVSGAYQIADRHGRARRQARARWLWELRLRFHQEVISELFEHAWLRDPPIIPRDDADVEPQQATLLLLDSGYNHPPEQGASNGTELVFSVNAELSAV